VGSNRAMCGRRTAVRGELELAGGNGCSSGLFTCRGLAPFYRQGKRGGVVWEMQHTTWRRPIWSRKGGRSRRWRQAAAAAMQGCHLSRWPRTRVQRPRSQLQCAGAKLGADSADSGADCHPRMPATCGRREGGEKNSQWHFRN
jgi:hypothetical protein